VRKGLKQPESYFPSPWVYFNVPWDDIPELLDLYRRTYLNPVRPTWQDSMGQVMHSERLLNPVQNVHCRELFTPKAMEAVKFAVIADFIGMKYERFHPTFKMPPMSEEVLVYLRPPFNQMKDWGYDDQKKFRDTLPDRLKREVYLDD